jgi:hypothetical protein
VGLTKKNRAILAMVQSDPRLTLEDAIRKVGGVSENSVPVIASRLRWDEEFVKAMERKTTQQIEALERKDDKLTAQDVLNTLAEIDGNCKAAGDIAWAVQARIKIVELRGKHLGMFADKVELSYGEELGKLLTEARERRRLMELPAIEGKLASD